MFRRYYSCAGTLRPIIIFGMHTIYRVAVMMIIVTEGLQIVISTVKLAYFLFITKYELLLNLDALPIGV
jgi:hypothetical protein